MTRGRVAFIDDEPRLCEAAAEWLGVSGFEVTVWSDPVAALAGIDLASCDCVVTDLRMPGMDGLEVLAHIRAADPDLPVILLSGHGDVPVAVTAMRDGAYDFIEKPYAAEHLVVVLDRAVEGRRLRRELAQLQSAVGAAARLETRLVGISPAIAALRETIGQLADVDVDILITGETGTGKEVVARAFHDFSRRARGAFVAINCAAIPEALFEGEIFGHEKGAFTGAIAARIGKFEYAGGGTVFLDEIESMPPPMQAKVLRALQERVVERVGSNLPRPIDVRFIAATKTDLKAAGEAGGFRPDLYFRLATVELTLPPLRARREDIPLLYARFAEEAARRFGRAVPQLRESDLRALQAQDWPGNVRELKSVAERHVLGMGPPPPPLPPLHLSGETLPDRIARFEAEAIAEALAQAGGATAEAARILGLPRRTLSEKIQRYGLRGA